MRDTMPQPGTTDTRVTENISTRLARELRIREEVREATKQAMHRIVIGCSVGCGTIGVVAGYLLRGFV
jgi:hypothetical protein